MNNKSQKKYIIVEGLIGAGKTSLAKALGARLNAVVQEEPADGVNPYLAKYYEDPKGYAFKMQIYLLKERFRAHAAAQSIVLAGMSDVVSDRSYFGDRCFAEVQMRDGYFSPDDMETYLDLHKDMQRSLLYPSCIIYLRTDVTTAMERISRRMSEKEGRKCECAIDVSYMISLAASIQRMVQSMEPYTNVIYINPLAYDENNECREKTLDELVDECIDALKHVKRDPYNAWQGCI